MSTAMFPIITFDPIVKSASRLKLFFLYLDAYLDGMDSSPHDSLSEKKGAFSSDKICKFRRMCRSRKFHLRQGEMDVLDLYRGQEGWGSTSAK